MVFLMWAVIYPGDNIAGTFIVQIRIYKLVDVDLMSSDHSDQLW